jgi:hypothetical protein
MTTNPQHFPYLKWNPKYLSKRAYRFLKHSISTYPHHSRRCKFNHLIIILICETKHVKYLIEIKLKVQSQGF